VEGTIKSGSLAVLQFFPSLCARSADGVGHQDHPSTSKFNSLPDIPSSSEKCNRLINTGAASCATGLFLLVINSLGPARISVVWPWKVSDSRRCHQRRVHIRDGKGRQRSLRSDARRLSWKPCVASGRLTAHPPVAVPQVFPPVRPQPFHRADRQCTDGCQRRACGTEKQLPGMR